MRAKEFVINVPITIKINGDGDPEIDMNKVNDENARDPSELDPEDPNPPMVPPLQQQIEINKAKVGKVSPVINDLTQDETEADDNTHYDQAV